MKAVAEDAAVVQVSLRSQIPAVPDKLSDVDI
jgi:hypothetical protein